MNLPKGKYVVKFGAKWCKACVAAERSAEALEALAVRVMRVDVDTADGSALAQKWGVMALPTWAVVKDGSPTWVKPSASLLDLRKALGIE